MTLKVDKAGRIILPKPVRDRLRLRAGSNLVLEERPDGLLLKLVEQSPSMVRKDGVWVHQGKAPKGFDWDTIVEASRDDRIKENSGV